MDTETIHSRMLAAAGRFTYREIADLTGVHPETVRRYMNGYPPSAEFLAAFCAALGVSADWVLFGRAPMNSTQAVRAALGTVPEADLFAALAEGVRGLDERLARMWPPPGAPIEEPPGLGRPAPDPDPLRRSTGPVEQSDLTLG